MQLNPNHLPNPSNQEFMDIIGKQRHKSGAR